MSAPGERQDPGVDRALRLTVPTESAEAVGAVLMDLLGAFEEQPSGETTTLVFYPTSDAAFDAASGETVSLEDVLAALPAELRVSGAVRLETRDVSREWVDGWKDHFRPIVIGDVRIRPPWEPALEGAAAEPAAPGGAGLVDVMINPGLGFGTGLHPTTRGTLRLLQGLSPAAGPRPGGPSERLLGPLVDAGTGSGILAIAAAKLGWGPVFAFDNDPVALVSARENIEANGVGGVVEVHNVDIAGASPGWFAGATVLANMTLEPVTALLRKLAAETGGWTRTRTGGGLPAGGPNRVIV
ncbi:MAG: 50S ribosomal protein L11 methyltransferase, partial [Thermoleophilia bacterium]|nr:50S ribosomal protein L11 methyltransferase [Thermoleophilia bacterium]